MMEINMGKDSKNTGKCKPSGHQLRLMNFQLILLLNFVKVSGLKHGTIP